VVPGRDLDPARVAPSTAYERFVDLSTDPLGHDLALNEDIVADPSDTRQATDRIFGRVALRPSLDLALQEQPGISNHWPDFSDRHKRTLIQSQKCGLGQSRVGRVVTAEPGHDSHVCPALTGIGTPNIARGASVTWMLLQRNHTLRPPAGTDYGI